MKKLMFVTAMALMLFGAIPAQAASHGSTVVPGIHIYYRTSTSYIATHIYLTNITGEEITCTIKLFDHTGANITSIFLAGIYDGSHTSASPSSLGTDSTFTIPAKGGRWLTIHRASPCSIVAHAIIEWSSEHDAMSQALAGTLRVSNISHERYAVGNMFINNGQPF